MRAAMLILSSLALAACNMSAGAQRGEPGGAERTYQVGAFDAVALGGSHDVVVQVGGAHSVRAVGDAKALDRLEVNVANGELRIRSKDKGWGFGHHGKVRVYVTAPALRAASVGGSGDMRIDRVEGPAFSGSVSGSGDMDIANVRVGEASFSVAGSGGVRAKGSAGRTNLSVAGSGELDLAQLEAGEAKVSVAGSGDVRARAMRTADISIVGSGDVAMTGTARCQVRKAGSGDVRCEG